MSRNELLKKIQQYNFAAYDMLLYLDTHPEDTKAFGLYRELVKAYRNLLDQYCDTYGPLTAYDSAKHDEFRWLESPWPWERQEEAR